MTLGHWLTVCNHLGGENGVLGYDGVSAHERRQTWQQCCCALLHLHLMWVWLHCNCVIIVLLVLSDSVYVDFTIVCGC